MLSTESGIHRHDKQQVQVADDVTEGIHGRRRIQGDSGLGPKSANFVELPVKVRSGLLMNREYVRTGTDNAHRSERVSIDDVEPGADATFTAATQIDLEAIDCVILDVNGPLPFGVAVD